MCGVRLVFQPADRLGRAPEGTEGRWGKSASLPLWTAAVSSAPRLRNWNLIWKEITAVLKQFVIKFWGCREKLVISAYLFPSLCSWDRILLYWLEKVFISCYNIDINSDLVFVFSGLWCKTWLQGSCTSNWSGYLCCPHLRSWTRYRTKTACRLLLPSNQKLIFCLFPSQALLSIKADRCQANDGLSSALLVVFLDSARNLPVSRSGPTSQHAPAAS